MSKRLLLGIPIILIALFMAACGTGMYTIGYDGEYATFNDTPGFKFKVKPEWAAANTANPFMMTPDYLDNCCIAIHRIRSGEKLPKGTIPIKTGMDIAAIEKLMTENIVARGDEFRIKDVTQAKVSGLNAVVVAYEKQEENYLSRGIEYGFMADDTFFNVIFIAKDGEYFISGYNYFDEMIQSFQVDLGK